MFTDIAGYTAQMSKDEAVAISLLNKKESVLKPLIAKHNGTYEYTWDAALYPSGVYLARLNINNTIYTQKLVLMK